MAQFLWWWSSSTMEAGFVLASRPAKKKSIQPQYLPWPGQAKSTRWYIYNMHTNCCLSTFQNTASNSYGVNKESVSKNLIKINVYYTSLNEKAVKDKIDYSFQVGSNFQIAICRMEACSTHWEVVSPFGLASPFAASLRSLSWSSTLLGISSTILEKKSLEGQLIHPEWCIKKVDQIVSLK